ncbi:hypothetical protein BGZ76_000248 [Entomortierella beljakovae]|nr:hypothetical protein BGZ76_000248 [Entomortierella beljakovae]
MSQRATSSERSVSPSSPPSSSLENGEKDATYPSPPMNDDEQLDSDDEEPLKNSDTKKMTSKEKRQLRNKLSARNFRVRRKEYISTLENQVKEARREAAEMQRRLLQSELNCQFLRQELETVRLSQSLFSDGRMSREHANLLASLLNPASESFPSIDPTSSSTNMAGSNMASSSSSSSSSSSNANILMPQNMHPNFPPPLPLTNAMPLFNNPLMRTNTQTSITPSFDLAQASLQPFVPFEGDWGLLINRAEVPETLVDPKDEDSPKKDAYEELLARYKAAKEEEELDEKMRTELKLHTEKNLSQTYMVSPKDKLASSSKSTDQEELFRQTLVYMMMVHVTQSLFEAATMSKSDIVKIYQTMDEQLRAMMKNEDANSQSCSCSSKFSEWREGWIRKCWPSFYNNRRRLGELVKNGPTPQKDGVDEVETARKMEESVKGKTVDIPKARCWPTWLKCSEDKCKSKLRFGIHSSKSSSKLDKPDPNAQ